MPLGHTVVRRVLAKAPILRDIVQANVAFSPERRAEDRGVPWHRELGKRLERCARQCIERVRLALFVDDVVEEGAYFGRRQGGGFVGGELDHSLEIELARQSGA